MMRCVRDEGMQHDRELVVCTTFAADLISA